GFVHFNVPGQSRKFEVQTVGPHIRFTSGRWAQGEARRTQLVLIGVGMDGDAVLRALGECVAENDDADTGAMLGVHRYTAAV
ncbi:MAG: GTP-binding protein, partial [Rhodococcus sp.]|nr:GTP-binding protein [Rhodococcus sp. (in: high G+C Gram-positive bacteria)]